MGEQDAVAVMINFICKLEDDGPAEAMADIHAVIDHFKAELSRL